MPKQYCKNLKMDEYVKEIKLNYQKNIYIYILTGHHEGLLNFAYSAFCQTLIATYKKLLLKIFYKKLNVRS